MSLKKITSILMIMAMSLGLVACSSNAVATNTAPSATEEGIEETAEEEVAKAEPLATDEETPELEGYNLLWSDEFNGDTLDEAKWTRELREPGWTNNELQEYTDSDENIFVKDGNLVLKAVKTEKDGKDYYTSGKVNSQNKQDFMYGKVVTRAKVPEGQGLWPAIWMMPKDEGFYGQWPKCGEIDIMEVLGSDVTTSYSTIHYGEPHAEQQGIHIIDNVLKKGTFASAFHEYSVEWEPGEMRFYTDNALVLTVNDWFTAENDVEKDYPAPFNQPFFVQMNLAVGGNWPGDPDETTDFDKAEFQIDYVRVYQKDSYDTNVEKPTLDYKEADENGNYITNGDFAEAEDLGDNENWKFILLNGGAGEAKIEDGMIIISSTNAGSEEYSVQLVQAGMPIMKGHKYEVSFDIKSDEERDFVTCVSAPTAGWIRYYDDTAYDINTEWQTITYDFEVTAKNDNNGRLEFNLGDHDYTATVYIKNVVFKDITQ